MDFSVCLFWYSRFTGKESYVFSVSDAWDTNVRVDADIASASAAKVLAAHAAGQSRDEVTHFFQICYFADEYR